MSEFYSTPPFCHLLFTRSRPSTYIKLFPFTPMGSYPPQRNSPNTWLLWYVYLQIHTSPTVNFNKSDLINPMLMSLMVFYFLVSSGHRPYSYQLSTFVATPRNLSPETSPPLISAAAFPIHDHNLLSYNCS